VKFNDDEHKVIIKKKQIIAYSTEKDLVHFNLRLVDKIEQSCHNYDNNERSSNSNENSQ